MTPKKKQFSGCDKNNCCNPKRVDPLPHLSTMHWEVAEGIPMIPRPAKPPPLDVKRRPESKVRGKKRFPPLTSCRNVNNTSSSNENRQFNCSFISETRNNDDESVTQRQRRLDLWNGNPNQSDFSHSEQMESPTSSTDEEWIEYWDEEVETSYYYNVKTGEASWFNPSEG